MLAPEQLLVASLAVIGVGAGARAIARPAEAGAFGTDRRAAWATAAAVVVAFVARVLVTEPVLLHANFHGAALVDEILAFPCVATHRAEYGQGSFFLLGALARVAGGTFERIVLVNQVLGVATLALLGVLAARVSNRAWTAPLVVLLGALDPALVRVAASEDAHTLATFLAAGALVGLEAGARTGSRAALVAGAAAALLVLWTRQTLYPVVALAGCLAFARADGARRRSPVFAGTLAVVGVAFAARVVHTLTHPTDAVTFRFLPVIIAHRPASLLVGHPLLDPRCAPALLPLGLAGIVALRRRVGGVVLGLGTIGLLLITLPFSFPTPGVELAFRVPVVALWLIPAAASAERLARAVPARRLAVPLAIVVAILPAALPVFARVRATTAATQEMHALRSLAASLPAGTSFVTLPTREPTPTVALPQFALPPDARVERLDRLGHSGDPSRSERLFLVGLQCRARSFMEVVPGATPEQLLATDLRRGLGTAHVQTDLRPECRALLDRATRVSAVLTIDAPDDPPFAFFAADRAPVNVSLWRLAEVPAAAPPSR